MTTATVPPPYRSDLKLGNDGFVQLLHAEWTKFRTVRGWVVAAAVAVAVMALISISAATGGKGANCVNGKCQRGPSDPIGPYGVSVTDSFYFVHQTLDGDGSITARISSLTDAIQPDPQGQGGAPPAGASVPWAKAGIIVKQSTTLGSQYAAVMATVGNGVRMQYNYEHDVAGNLGAASSASPAWLRLVRSGTTLTGYDSADGTHWTEIGTADLTGLASTVQVGLFATSPGYNDNQYVFGGLNSDSFNSLATAQFDNLALGGGWSGDAWNGDAIGGADGQYQQTGSGFTVQGGNGDITPDVPDDDTARLALSGAFAGLIALIVIAAMFMTTEYRRGLLRTTLAASPRRGRVLAAKAVVVGAVSFAVGLVAAAVSVPVFNRLWSPDAFYPVGALTEARVVLGTAALLAVVAVFTLALATLMRRSTAVITTVIILVIMPYFLATTSVLTPGPSDWLLRLTPAAGFAIQQTIPRFAQLTNVYTPTDGFYPLAPWSGFAVLCAYTAVALGAALLVLRRRDA
ncbi:MAG TPA: ABC transporter permease subunit [Actinocrinis sp.]|jgi:ABC-type transport system involved in multi-copper enzyme maturation permease subunit